MLLIYYIWKKNFDIIIIIIIIIFISKQTIRRY